MRPRTWSTIFRRGISLGSLLTLPYPTPTPTLPWPNPTPGPGSGRRSSCAQRAARRPVSYRPHTQKTGPSAPSPHQSQEECVPTGVDKVSPCFEVDAPIWDLGFPQSRGFARVPSDQPRVGLEHGVGWVQQHDTTRYVPVPPSLADADEHTACGPHFQPTRGSPHHACAPQTLCDHGLLPPLL